jgi:hypothetical protein
VNGVYVDFFGTQTPQGWGMLAQGSATGIMQPAISIPFSAEVAKSVDAVDSKSTVEIRAGSSPAFGTKTHLISCF